MRLGVGHALHAVHARFELELSKCAAAADLGDDFLVAAHGALVGGNELDLPALLGGEALVHAEQVAGEQRSFITARAGADFEDHVALVHRVLGQERDLDLRLQRRAPLLQARLLGGRHLAHLGVGLGIVDERVEPLELGDHAAIGFHGVDDRPELGELARQLHIGLGRELTHQLVLHRLVAGHQRIEFLFGQHVARHARRRWPRQARRA